MCLSKKDDDNENEKRVMNIDDSRNGGIRDEFDQITENVRRIGGNLGEIADGVFNMTSDYMNDINNRAKFYTWKWLFDDNVNSDGGERTEGLRNIPFFDRFSKSDFPVPYETRSSFNGDGDSISPFFRPWGFGGDSFGDFFAGCRKSGKTPFGFYSLKGPSLRSYNECRDRNGESIWDSQGYWRCLFPNAEVRNEVLEFKNKHLPNEILTKEDLRNAIDSNPGSESDDKIDLGVKGVFFRQYTDFLDWKNLMIQNVKRDREMKRQRLIESKSQGTDFETKDVSKKDGKQIVSKSVQTTFESFPDKDEVVYKEWNTEYYADGTSKTTTLTKSKPLEAKEWEKVTKDVAPEAPSSNPSSSSGWFWNSNEK